MPVRRHAAMFATMMAAALTAALVVPAADAAPTPPGSLDPTFSPGGLAGVTDVIAGQELYDLAVQSDGKIVALSDTGPDLYLVRYDANGAIDPSFGNAGTGIVTVDVGALNKNDKATAIAIDAQDRIVVTGTGASDAGDLVLVRLSADGKSVQLDKHVHIGDLSEPTTGTDIAFQSDGTIVVGGSGDVGPRSGFVVIRFDPTTGFILGIPQTTTFTADADLAYGVGVYPSGPNKDKIVLVGATAASTSDGAIGVVQRNPDGTADPTFAGGAGQLTIDPTTTTDEAAGVAITASGSVLVVGQNGLPDEDVVLAQLLPSGAYDPAFNAGSPRTVVRTGAEDVREHPLALQPDGKFVVVADTGDDKSVGVFRFTANGADDPSFGTGGVATLAVGTEDDANAVVLDGQGRILVAGDHSAEAGGFVARFIGAAPVTPPTSAPEATLKGNKVVLDTVLAKKKASAKCPAKATVAIKTKAKGGKVKVTKQLKTTTVPGGCRVKGKVNLHVKPKKTAKVKVTVTGKKLKTKHLTAVRP